MGLGRSPGACAAASRLDKGFQSITLLLGAAHIDIPSFESRGRLGRSERRTQRALLMGRVHRPPEARSATSSWEHGRREGSYFIQHSLLHRLMDEVTDQARWQSCISSFVCACVYLKTCRGRPLKWLFRLQMIRLQIRMCTRPARNCLASPSRRSH